MKMYEACNIGYTIKIVEVDRVTEHKVVIKGRLNSKFSSYQSYFNTFREAREWLMKGLEKKLEQNERKNDELRIDLTNVFKMEET